MPASSVIDRFLHPQFVQHYRQQVQTAFDTKTPSIMPAEPPTPNNTSHLSVIDEDGLAVSLTTTAGESAGYVVAGTGFIPNNIMGEADLHPHGFHAIPSGKRIQTMMTPAIVLKDGTIRMVVGSGGSTRIRSAILQTMNNLLDYHMGLQEVVETPRIHLDGATIQCEAGYNQQAVVQLEAMGYQLNRWENRSMYFGGAHAVSRTESGRLVAAGDSRRGGVMAGG